MRLHLVFCLSISAALFTGCGEQHNNEQTATYTDTATVAKTVPAANPDTLGFTLPVLDALFYEDGFEAQLKSELQLTDEQVQKLKEVAHASVANLTEEGPYSGSTRAANAYSREQVKNVIGEEKTNQLLQLVARRYANGDTDGLLPTQPNAIPTDTRVIVNIPAFRMDVFQDGKLLKTYRIGIGYPEFPLPIGMRRAEQIIFNPTWTPPDEPWVKGKVQPGKKVAAGSKLNPLGPIKIPIGLPNLIHGGKAVSKLGNFASHGCVGLSNQQVQDFAGQLSQLSGTQLTVDSISGFEKNKTETKNVKLNKAIPVELRYETIVAENGNLHIYRDVYERGTNTQENLTGVLAVYGIKYESLSEQEKAAITQALNAMNQDAKGEPIAGVGNNANATNDTLSKNSEDTATDKKERTKKGKVTKAVKRQKEIVVPVGALAGKGYPAPVSLDSGAKSTVTRH